MVERPGQRDHPSAAGQFPLARLAVSAPLVGREGELGFLKDQFDAAEAGLGGHLILVSGAPGVGKTRLAREVGLYARARGGRVLEGHYLRDGAAAYGPWVEALRAALREVGRAELAPLVGVYGAELSQIFPELAERLDPLPPRPRSAAGGTAAAAL